MQQKCTSREKTPKKFLTTRLRLHSDGFTRALMLPYPAQDHVIPLMELAHCLVDRSFKITFIITEFNHARVIAALSESRIHLVTIPDGLIPGEDRNDVGKLTEGILNINARILEELIRIINKKGEKLTCFIAG